MDAAIKDCRLAFVAVAIFSFLANSLILVLPIYMFSVMDRVMTSMSMSTLAALFTMAMTALAFQGVFEAARSYVMVEIGNYLDRRLGPRLFNASISFASQRGNPAGSEALGQFESLRMFLSSPGVMSLLDAPWTPVFLVVLYMINSNVGLVATIGAVLLTLLAVINKKWSQDALEQADRASRRPQAWATAAMRNAEIVEAMGMTTSVIKEWHTDKEKVRLHQSKASKRAAIVGAISKWGRMVVQISVMTVAIMAILQPGSALTPASMMASVILVARALMPLEMMIGSFEMITANLQNYRNIKSALESMQERPRLTVYPTRPEGALSVENVVYEVKGLDRPILNNISFAVAPGESVGVIGPSGCGKTTLASLLVGLSKPTSGAVRLDGTDVHLWPSEDLGRHIGYLPQTVELFAGTVLENIGRQNPHADKEMVVGAAKLADLHELIQRFPLEYDTNVGAGGSLLSGGQRQRVGLARALFGGPRFVVLDEPNSNLDNEGEMALQKTLAILKEQGVTVILIAHRINILQFVDKILVMRNGAVHKFADRDDVIAPVATATTERKAIPNETPAVEHQAEGGGRA